MCYVQIINLSGQRLHVNDDNRGFIVCFDLHVFIGDHIFFATTGRDIRLKDILSSHENRRKELLFM